jgi:hypothetical protein
MHSKFVVIVLPGYSTTQRGRISFLLCTVLLCADSPDPKSGHGPLGRSEAPADNGRRAPALVERAPLLVTGRRPRSPWEQRPTAPDHVHGRPAARVQSERQPQPTRSRAWGGSPRRAVRTVGCGPCEGRRVAAGEGMGAGAIGFDPGGGDWPRVTDRGGSGAPRPSCCLGPPRGGASGKARGRGLRDEG